MVVLGARACRVCGVSGVGEVGEEVMGKIADTLPTPERIAKGGVRIENGRCYVSESNIERYFDRGWITIEHKQAGDELYKDFYYAGIPPGVTASWNDARVACGRTGFTTAQLEARDRFYNAMLKMSRVSQDVLWSICLQNHNLEWFEQKMQYRSGFARMRLIEALDDLWGYYKNSGIF